MVAHAYNPNTQEAEAGGLPSSLRPPWTSSEDHVMVSTTQENCFMGGQGDSTFLTKEPLNRVLKFTSQLTEKIYCESTGKAVSPFQIIPDKHWYKLILRILKNLF